MSQNLKKRAESVRDETGEGKNTAYRVGGIMVDIVDEMSDVKSRLDSFMGLAYVETITFPPEGGGVVLRVKSNVEAWIASNE